MYIKLDNQEINLLRTYENPGKWNDWKELSPKLRFVLQRMVVDKVGGKSLVMDIAKEASHKRDSCKWCEHQGGGAYFKNLVKEVFVEPESAAISTNLEKIELPIAKSLEDSVINEDGEELPF